MNLFFLCPDSGGFLKFFGGSLLVYNWTFQRISVIQSGSFSWLSWGYFHRDGSVYSVPDFLLGLIVLWFFPLTVDLFFPSYDCHPTSICWFLFSDCHRWWGCELGVTYACPMDFECMGCCSGASLFWSTCTVEVKGVGRVWLLDFECPLFRWLGGLLDCCRWYLYHRWY